MWSFREGEAMTTDVTTDDSKPVVGYSHALKAWVVCLSPGEHLVKTDFANYWKVVKP